MGLRQKLTDTAEHFRQQMDPDATESVPRLLPVDPATQPVLLIPVPTVPQFTQAAEGQLLSTPWDCMTLPDVDFRDLDVLRIYGKAYVVVGVRPYRKDGKQVMQMLRLQTLSPQDAQALP